MKKLILCAMFASLTLQGSTSVSERLNGVVGDTDVSQSIKDFVDYLDSKGGDVIEYVKENPEHGIAYAGASLTLLAVIKNAYSKLTAKQKKNLRSESFGIVVAGGVFTAWAALLSYAIRMADEEGVVSSNSDPLSL